MNSDEFAGQWNRMKGSVREHWGRLTDDDVNEIDGKREQLVGKIQEKYGDTRQAAEEKLKQFERRF